MLASRQHTGVRVVFPLGSNLAQEVWGWETGFIWGKRANKQLSSGVFAMHVGGSGPAPQPALKTQGRKCIPPTLQLLHQSAPERWKPQTLGQRGGATENVGWRQRPPAVRGDQRGRLLALPWAAHIHAHINTPEEHTYTRTHRCQNIHIRHKSTSHTYTQSLRVEANNKASIM